MKRSENPLRVGQVTIGKPEPRHPIPTCGQEAQDCLYELLIQLYVSNNRLLSRVARKYPIRKVRKARRIMYYKNIWWLYGPPPHRNGDNNNPPLGVRECEDHWNVPPGKYVHTQSDIRFWFAARYKNPDLIRLGCSWLWGYCRDIWARNGTGLKWAVKPSRSFNIGIV